MNGIADDAPAKSVPRQISIARLLRVQAGVGGVLAIAVAAANLRPNCPWGPIPPIQYTATTVAVALVGYVVLRNFFRRPIALFAAMAAAGIAAERFSRPKCDQMEVAALGMLIPLALFVGFGWLDRNRDGIAVSTGSAAASDPSIQA